MLGCWSNHSVASKIGKRNDGIRERKLARGTTAIEIIKIYIGHGAGSPLYYMITSQILEHLVTDKTGMGYYLRWIKENQYDGEGETVCFGCFYFLS